MNERGRWRAVGLALLVVLSTVAASGVAGAFPESAGQPTDLDQSNPSATLGESTAFADWPTSGHDSGRSGHDPNASGPATDVDARWVFEAENLTRNEPAAVADGRVFVPTRDGLRVLDNETGEQLWAVSDLTVDHVSVSEDVAVVTTSGYNEESVRAYDVTDGMELWTVTDFEARSSVASNGTVYVERYYQNVDEVRLYAFDLATGDELWSVQHADDVGGGLSADGDTVYATWKLSDSWDREYAVFALDASDGSERWRFEVEGRITMAPTVVNGTVYVGAGDEVEFGGDVYDPKFYALNASDGHVEWIHDAHARPNGAAVANGTVYVSMGNGIHALDAASGERQWVHRMAGDIDVGLVYTTIDANPPAVADGVVYATNDRGFVDAIDGNTGDVLWTYRVEGQATDPVIADERVYVHTTDEEDVTDDDIVRVYALEAEPFAFSGLTTSTTTPAPGELVAVDVTVENVDDEAREYDLSLMADPPLHVDWWATDRVNGTLNAGESKTFTFETRLNTSGSWNLSIKRDLEVGPSTESVTVEVIHSTPVDDWPTWKFDAGLTGSNPDAVAPKHHLQERWNVNNFHRDTRPVVADGTAYVVHSQRRDGENTIFSLAAYDVDTGVREWEFNVSDRNRLPAGSATVEEDTVYLYTTPFNFDGNGVDGDGTVFALNASDGGVEWTHDTSLNRSLTSDQAPIVADGRVYVAGGTYEPNTDQYANASVIALSATDGSVAWTYDRTERSTTELFHGIAVADGTVYAALQNEEWVDSSRVHYDDLVAIDASSGTARWSTESRPFNLDLTEQPVVSGDLVYVINQTAGADGDAEPELHALNVSDGGERWRFVPHGLDETADGWRLFDPVVTDDAVFLRQYELGNGISYDRSHLYRIDAADGALDWNWSTAYPSTLLAVDGLLYIGEGDDEPTHLYDAQTGEYYGSTDITARASGTVLAVANGTLFTVEQSGQPLRVLAEGGHFEFTDLAVDSEWVDMGENVTVTATVTNRGTMARSWNANLLVSPDEDRQDHHVWNYPSRDGTLAPGESETATWTVRLDERGDYVFTLQPNYEDTGMNAYLADRTAGVTVSAGDSRDGETIPFIGPREMPSGPDAWPKESLDAGNTGNNTGTGAPTAVGGDIVNWSVNHSYEWTTGPTLANETVFVGGNHVSGGAFVYAFNATDGELQWQYLTYSASDVVVPPTYAGGYVYTATSDGRVYQFDAATGERLWTYNGLGDVGGITVVDDVAYVSGYAYVDSADSGTVHALNASTREVLWTFTRASSYYGMNVKPAVENGTVYVTSDDGYTYALDAATGGVVWNQSIAGTGSSLHSPVVEDGVVYVDDAEWDSTVASIYALDATDGSPIWSAPANVDGYTGSSPALVNDTLYFTADGAVRAIDATGGDELWSTQICSAVRYSPVYADGVVYVPTTDSAIRAYDADTGDLMWRYDAYDEHAFTPAVVDGLLYTTGLENDDNTYSLLALEGGPTNQSKTLFDYYGLTVSSENVSTGQSFTVSATVENQGDAACGYTASLKVDDSVVDTTAGTVGTGYNDDDLIEVTHSFSSTGTYNVSIEDLPPVEVTVTEPQPDVDVTPSSWDYGTAEVDAWVYKDFEVTNLGQGDLHWSDSVITGPDADEFSITSDDSQTYSFLWSGGSGYVRVYLTSETPGTKTATLEIHTDDPDEPVVSVPLTGTVEGGQANVQVTPSTLDFGDVTVGSTAEANVTVENVGDTTLTFDGVTLGSSDFGSFDVVAGDTQLALGPGESHNVTVEFAPTSENPDTATLTVNTDDPNDPAVHVMLSGTGTAEPVPDIDVSPSSHYFESVPVDDTETTTFAVTNTGDAALDVTGFTVAGANASDFTVQSSPFTVAPGGTETVAVEFAPTTLGTKSATVEVASTDADEPTVVLELGGQAIDATPPTLDIVDVAGSNEAGDTVYANGTVTVEVNATDEHSSIESVLVGLDSEDAEFVAIENATFDATAGNWTATFDSDDMPDDGNYSVAALATDAAGNQNVVFGTETVVVDRTRPQLGASLSRLDGTTAAVNLTASEPLQTGSIDVTVTRPDGTDTSVTMTGTGTEWNGTFGIDEDGRYEIDATGVDHAGNQGSDNATATFRNLTTTNRTVTVVLEPSGTFVRFNTSADVDDTYVVLTDSRTPLAPLGNDRAGLNFLRAQLGAQLTDNLTDATIGVPVDELRLPRGAGKGDVNLSYFNRTTKEWEDLGTEIRTVTVNGTTGEYWVTSVAHFSTYGTVVTDTRAPTLDGAGPTGTLAAGTTRTDVRFDYSDDISGVDASSVQFEFDGEPADASRLSVTKRYASYDATGLSAGSYDATVTVADGAGNVETFTHSFTIAAASSGGSSGGNDDGNNDSGNDNDGNDDGDSSDSEDDPTPTPSPTRTPSPTPTDRPTSTPTADGTESPTATSTATETTSPREPTPTTTTTRTTTPGFTAGTALLALLAAIALVVRRRR
ncbi:PQQ-binding-like beta-propeller repeat protein [Halorarum halophilum]|uniref:PQQ-binding-like beta-propeller repeat protein n=1 Tax=Halorarum halophilum TaxID=2743090 RepID=A0A7D5K939_9EURY|nr:PQQ-binding-like beta-propeller repeat protein [Halobaculum halophilum]QLG28694.1 PQQ-binding-like beta-propeller repeat protein [Halobaculum halophilum]